MNKHQLADALTSRTGMNHAAAVDTIDALLDAIVRAVADGQRVSITGFGTFERTERGARLGRNPRTGDSVPIDATAVPKFRPGTSFKTYVAEPATLPLTRRAAGRAPVGTAALESARTAALIDAARAARTRRTA